MLHWVRDTDPALRNGRPLLAAVDAELLDRGGIRPANRAPARTLPRCPGRRRWPGWAAGLPTHSTTPTAAACCTATSSRPTCCSPRTAHRNWPTSTSATLTTCPAPIRSRSSAVVGVHVARAAEAPGPGRAARRRPGHPQRPVRARDDAVGAAARPPTLRRRRRAHAAGRSTSRVAIPVAMPSTNCSRCAAARSSSAPSTTCPLNARRRCAACCCAAYTLTATIGPPTAARSRAVRPVPRCPARDFVDPPLRGWRARSAPWSVPITTSAGAIGNVAAIASHVHKVRSPIRRSPPPSMPDPPDR